MSTPPDALHQPAFAADADEVRVRDPDDPPWSALTGVLTWLASIVLMAFVPLVFLIPYFVYRVRGVGFDKIDEALVGDPTMLLIGVAAALPTHLATFLLVWAVVTGYGRRPFWPTIGWGWPPWFGPWLSFLLSVVAAALLLVAAALVIKLLGVKRTPFDDMLESSTAALFTTAFLATATAPLVEELVYRGVLYPALRRATNIVFAVLIVTFLFASVHFWQYKNSPGTIGAIILLSFALTCVRAATGRVLPCVVIHFVFNGVQVAGLVYEYFLPSKPANEAQQAALFEFVRLSLFN